jgi:hypothetical protein
VRTLFTVVGLFEDSTQPKEYRAQLPRPGTQAIEQAGRALLG